MVMSHKKLKRKRAEEAAAAAAAAIANSEGAKEEQNQATENENGSHERKKEKKRKRNKVLVTDGSVDQFADVSHEDDGGVEIEKPVGGENAGKNKKKKEKKKRSKGASEVAPVADEDRLSNGKLNGAVDHSEVEAEPTPSNAGRPSHHDEKGDSENGGQANGGQETDNCNQTGMTVRERKGKKKKDRWGVVVQEEQEEAVAAVKSEEDRNGQTSVEEVDELSGVQRYDSKKVYVGGMPYYVTEEDIVDYFSECGKVTELDCVLFPDTGKFRGLAFITFQTEEGARKALELDGCEMGGRFLKITPCKIRDPRGNKKSAELGEVEKHEGCLSAYVGNLSWNITEDVLKNFLKKHFKPTKIEAIRFAYDKVTGDFRGYGHIDFGDDDSLEAAIRLNQTELLGRPVKIAYSVPKRTPSTNKSNSGEREVQSGSCYRCGKRGHKAYLCPEKDTGTNPRKD